MNSIKKTIFQWGVIFILFGYLLAAGWFVQQTNSSGNGRYSLPIATKSITPLAGCAYQGTVPKWRVPFYPLVQNDSNLHQMRDPYPPQILLENGKNYGRDRVDSAIIASTTGSGFLYRSGQVIFGSTDCSDPRINGRDYQLAMPLTVNNIVLNIVLIIDLIILLFALRKYWNLLFSLQGYSEKKWLTRSIFILVTVIFIGFLHWQFRNSMVFQDPHASVVADATNSAIKNSSCAAESKKFMVTCRDGKFYNYADTVIADDYGQIVLINLRAVVTERAQTVKDALIINYELTLIAIGLLAGIVFSIGGLPSIIFLFIILYNHNSLFYGASSHYSHFAAAIFALVPSLSAIWCVKNSHKSIGKKLLCGLLVLISFLLLFFASLLRQAIALMGVISLVSVILLIYFSERKSTTINSRSRNFRLLKWAAIFILPAIVAFEAPLILVWIDSYFYGMVPNRNHIGHGFSHTLYVGLGDVPNSLGLAWDDEIGISTIKRYDSNIIVYSKDYYSALWHIYFQTIYDHPFEVTRIYLAKIITFFNHSQFNANSPNWLLYPITYGLLMVNLIKDKKIIHSSHVNYYIFAMIIMVGLFIMQSLATSVNFIYYYPAQFLTIAILSVSLSWTISLIMKRVNRNAKN